MDENAGIRVNNIAFNVLWPFKFFLNLISFNTKKLDGIEIVPPT